MQFVNKIKNEAYKIIAVVLGVMMFYNLNLFNPLLFHTVIEFICVFISLGIAAITFHTNKISQEDDFWLNFFGVTYFNVAIFDFLHTLAYQGIGIPPGNSANLAVQLWIIPRYFESITFLLIAHGLPKSLHIRNVLLLTLSFSAGILVLVFTGFFPAFYLPGAGFTLPKIISEYIIIILLFSAIFFLLKRRLQLDSELYRQLLLACLATISAEIFFFLSSSANAAVSLLVHLCKLVSYYFIYDIVIRKRLLGPYETIKDLYQNMERKVATRTRELEAANLRLREGQKILTQLNQKLSETNRLKSEFMATVTHELKTPLTSIVAFCELLLDETAGPLTEEQRENLMDINVGAQQLMILISDILDMAKYEAGNLRLSLEKVDLNDVLQIVWRTMAPIAAQHRISLEIKKAELPLVLGDPERLRQMIVNLISNSIKFTEEGGNIWVWATKEGNYAAVHVKDTGAGISPEFLPHIFEKFRQGDGSLKRQRNGTGLGLALVKTLAELQGGNVSVKSELGKGAQFTLKIPFAQDSVGGEGIV
ncbi:MAG: hypothetical protein GX893_05835 [Firmicutes bacterium]|nr:hypothetical protein [Bacillota bacterium]